MSNSFKHLVPLVLFTVLAIVGSGLMIGVGLLFYMGFGSGSYLLWAFILIGIGVMISFFHLGRKERFLRAVVGAGHSWLSREVIVAGIFAVFAGGGYFLVRSGKGGGLLSLVIGIGVVSAVFLVLTIGMVYNLVTRLSWSGFFNWSGPFAAALLLGSSCFVLGSMNSRFIFIFYIVWGFDFIFALMRAVGLRGLMGNEQRFVFQHLMGFTWAGHILRLVFSFCVVIAFVLALDLLVLFSIIGTVILDRLSLYAGVVEVTPRSEIAVLKAERMKEAVEKQS